MSDIRYNLVSTDSENFLTIYTRDRGAVSVESSHPHFDFIVAGIIRGDESVIDLMDPATTVAIKLTELSERVTVAYGRVFLDGDEVHGAIARHIGRYVIAGVEDYRPYVSFLEKLSTNPSQHSRDQLFDWLEAHEFTITQDGDIVAFKGVDGRDGNYQSTTAGNAIVDNVPVEGHIPNQIGSVVTMPRSEVVEDPSTACSEGLHVGTYGFAKTFGTSLLEVHVNPRDVVSVPTRDNGDKVRVCRYRVIDVADGPYDVPVLGQESDDSPYAEDKAVLTGKAPSTRAFNELSATARTQKKGVAKLAERKGWVLVGENPKDRLSWIIPAES